jgi:hypothetical protein
MSMNNREEITRKAIEREKHRVHYKVLTNLTMLTIEYSLEKILIFQIIWSLNFAGYGQLIHKQLEGIALEKYALKQPSKKTVLKFYPGKIEQTEAEFKGRMTQRYQYTITEPNSGSNQEKYFT